MDVKEKVWMLGRWLSLLVKSWIGEGLVGLEKVVLDRRKLS